ncbi:cysteine desulfurase [Maribacter polysiphoniae]|uniref:cysteine desulfurase n=1 Tax=Maribacter polysiphoniae TaxID=429344 RepID=A0A316DW91_9FLAO|nr:cysteine desulfurase family protein [Maribacter polysiphoniae]MBD1263001.1 cysteine desulfurase [Maribacter polysiphoniae]PWK22066.1 cysteine desulfurase [Maribacter polysiphoniae]
MKNVYLDNAATTQIRKGVIERMQKALTDYYGNPSSTYSYGRTSKTAIESARKIIAKTLKAHPSEIIFTSGGTEADNMILKSAVRDLGVKTIITSRIEHHAVLHTAQDLAKEYNIALKFVDLDENGTPQLPHLEQLLHEDNTKKLVTLMHVNNEIGNLLPIGEVAEMCKANSTLFHSDTVQSIGHYALDVTKVPIDFMAASAHKFHGPKGVGFAFVRKNSGLKPLISGGGQERGLRAGTESVHNIVGLEEAFQLAYEHLDKERAYIEGLKKYFMARLTEVIPDVVFNGLSGSLDESTYTLVNVGLPISDDKTKMLLFNLDMKGIACSKGSACQSGSDAGSHVLNQLQKGEGSKRTSLRFSFSTYNTTEELDYTITVLKQLIGA